MTQSLASTGKWHVKQCVLRRPPNEPTWFCGRACWWQLSHESDGERDLVAATTRLNELLERMIRRAPDQYLWIHDRFRRAPACGVVDAVAANRS